MSGLHLRSRQMFASTHFMQTRRFSYKFSRVFSPLGSHVSGNDPKILSQETHKNLKGKTKNLIDSAPEWNEKLASESEATVKADRHDRHSSITIEELQRQSIDIMEEHDYEPQEQRIQGQHSTSERE